MSGFKKFFRKLFGGGDATEGAPPAIICRKIGNQYYAYRRAQGNYEQIAGPFSTCEQCRSNYAGAPCTE